MSNGLNVVSRVIVKVTANLRYASSLYHTTWYNENTMLIHSRVGNQLTKRAVYSSEVLTS